MASEKQYLYFKFLYDEEEKRFSTLQDHAKNNLTLVTLYSAFLGFAFDKEKISNFVSLTLFTAAMLLMVFAFLTSLWATQISTYEAPSDPEEILAEMGDTPPSDDEFFDDRIVDFSVAYKRNSNVNDSKASWLSLARYSLLLGIFVHACYYLTTAIS